MNLIIVVAMQRTGSTLLAKDLTSIGLGVIDEHFMPLFAEGVEAVSVVDFTKILMRGKNEINNVGLKLMINHASSLYRIISGDNVEYSLDEGYLKFVDLLRSFFDNMLVFSINRSHIERCVSSYVAHKTRLYHIEGSEYFYSGPSLCSLKEVIFGHIDFDVLNKISTQVLYEMEYFEKVKGFFVDSIINIDYNDIVTKPDVVAKTVARRAQAKGVGVVNNNFAPRTLKKIIAPEMFEAFIANVESQANSIDSSLLSSWRLLRTSIV